MNDELDAALAAHDELVARRGVEVWVGAEPTFTRTDSQEPAWLGEAEGADKLERAQRLADALTSLTPGARMGRVAGRQFEGEAEPRFSLGVRWSDAREVGDVAETPPTFDELDGDHWATVTPDPGVVEVNLAPCSTAGALWTQSQRVWKAAEAAGLSPLRYRFNGEIADSGGGGQLSIGGSRPTTSPFLRYPHVLPGLVRYVNNHPSLSYWFASECTGSASQGPRPDEGTRERWDELAVALAWVEARADRGDLASEHLWSALAPLLVDGAGNTHRAELNIEKLWNPHLGKHGPRHGTMGLVEMRSVRMPERPGMLAALAALMRSIIARLAVSGYREPLVDWHDDLHDRFALPAALSRDLRFVLGDLDEHGLGLPAQLRRELEAWRTPGVTCRLGDATLQIRPALEFWPLVGDVASQERAMSRIVDASTARVELSLDGAGPDRIAVAGKWAHLRSLGDGVRAVGVRRRVFQPSPGFHPDLPVTDPLVIDWAWGGRTQRIEMWAWSRDGSAYPDAPADALTALERRQDRIRITTRVGDPEAYGHWPEARPYTIDLRRLPA